MYDTSDGFARAQAQYEAQMPPEPVEHDFCYACGTPSPGGDGWDADSNGNAFCGPCSATLARLHLDLYAALTYAQGEACGGCGECSICDTLQAAKEEKLFSQP